MGDNEKDQRYILVVKDDRSAYCWLEPSSSAGADHIAEVLASWMREISDSTCLGISSRISFQERSHGISRFEHRIRHSFSVAYSPWANGSVESLMISVLSANRAMLAKLNLAPQDWTSILPSIASALNQASLARFGKD